MHMSRIWKPIVSGFILCLVVAPVLALGQGQDVEGSKDHPLVSRYTGSWIIAYAFKEYDEYLFPTGKLVAEDKLQKSEHLEGKITRITYQAPQGRSTLEIYRNFENASNRPDSKSCSVAWSRPVQTVSIPSTRPCMRTSATRSTRGLVNRGLGCVTSAPSSRAPKAMHT